MSADVIPVVTAWQQMEKWFAEHNPPVLETFRPPALPGAISAAERALGRALPSDYKAFLATHNGQDQDSPRVAWASYLAILESQERGLEMFEHASLLPIESVAKQYKGLLTLQPRDVDAKEVDDQVRPTFFSAGWVPIGCSPRGKDFLCIDFDPTELGTLAQVIFLSVDFSRRRHVAASFAELLTQFVAKAEAYDDVYG
jgi:uncharacterized protein